MSLQVLRPLRLGRLLASLLQGGEEETYAWRTARVNTDKPKILIVEDDPAMQHLLAEVLARFGVEARCVASGREAADIVKREKFSAVFLDWFLPGLTGLEVAQHVRASGPNARCPLVMITGNPDPEAIKQCFRAGVNFFLSKPVTLHEIEGLLNATRGLMLQERRRSQRVRVELPVRCEWENPTPGAFPRAQAAKGVTVDLSATGLLVKLNAAPPVGITVEVEFSLPAWAGLPASAGRAAAAGLLAAAGRGKEPERLSLQAAVVRVMQDGSVGLHFEALSAGQRERLLGAVEQLLLRAPEALPRAIGER